MAPSSMQPAPSRKPSPVDPMPLLYVLLIHSPLLYLVIRSLQETKYAR